MQWPTPLKVGGNGFWKSGQRHGQTVYQDKAILTSEKAIEATPASHPDLVSMWAITTSTGSNDMDT